MAYKKVVTSSTTTFYGLTVYTTTGYGKIMGAIYSDRNGLPWNLLASSAAYPSGPSGWVTVPVSYSAAAGTYWLATEVAAPAKIMYNQQGVDKFQYNQFGSFPSRAVVQNTLGNVSMYGSFCN